MRSARLTVVEIQMGKKIHYKVFKKITLALKSSLAVLHTGQDKLFSMAGYKYVVK